jgi:glycosyltransferase involved in cell wall biosynthesis
MLKINIVLPFVANRPGGGVKIMYEYANRLSLRGHDVTVLHSIRRPFKKSHTPIWFRLAINRLRPSTKWFFFNPKVTRVVVPEVTDRWVPDADATISTWWQMTYALAALSPAKGRKINLIQDYETWTGQVDKVHESYKLPVHNAVIAKYLAEKVRLISGRSPVHIPNAIDTEKFRINQPIDSRARNSVIMLWSREERKGSRYGIEALMKLKEQLPALHVTFFSVFDRPAELASWIAFHQQPANLPELYNDHAIFFSPSLGEGWALPPAEAMACGCAVICTDIGGHRDYATHEHTALLVQPTEVDEMVATIHRLILNNELRIELARSGAVNIHQQFSWESSVKEMEKLASAN